MVYGNHLEHVEPNGHLNIERVHDTNGRLGMSDDFTFASVCGQLFGASGRA